MKISIVFITFIILLFLGTPLYLMKGAVACEMAKLLGYIEIQPNIFASINSSKSIEDIAFINDGIERVNNVFGVTLASPKLILVDSVIESRKFFASETATSHFSPFSNCLVLGPKGQNTNVAAHELVHAEIYQRLGWLVQILRMPRWFEEGVSLMVDWREPFLPENIILDEAAVSKVRKHFYGYQFNTVDVFKHYQASRLAVNSLDTQTFYSNLEKLKNGNEFNDVFVEAIDN